MRSSRAVRGAALAALCAMALAAPCLGAAPTNEDVAAFFSGCEFIAGDSRATNQIRGTCRGHTFSAEGLRHASPCAAFLGGGRNWTVTSCVVDGQLADQTTFRSDTGELIMIHPMGPAQAKAITSGPFPALRRAPASPAAGTAANAPAMAPADAPAHAAVAAPAAGAAAAGPAVGGPAPAWFNCGGFGQCRDVEIGSGAVAAPGSYAKVHFSAWSYDAKAVDFKGTPVSPDGWVADRGYELQPRGGEGETHLVIRATTGMKVGGRRLLALPPVRQVLELRLDHVAPTLALLRESGEFKLMTFDHSAAVRSPLPVHAARGGTPAPAKPGDDVCLQGLVQSQTGIHTHDPSLDMACAAVAEILRNARRNGTVPALAPGGAP
jgi:hypothetical protein